MIEGESKACLADRSTVVIPYDQGFRGKQLKIEKIFRYACMEDEITLNGRIRSLACLKRGERARKEEFTELREKSEVSQVGIDGRSFSLIRI